MDRCEMKEYLEELCEKGRKAAECAGEAVKAGAAKVEEGAENAVAYARCMIARRELEAALKEQLMEVGRLVYATYSGDPTDSEVLEEVLHRIEILKEAIREQENDMAAIRGVRKCKACGAANSPEHGFCSSCGSKL